MRRYLPLWALPLLLALLVGCQAGGSGQGLDLGEAPWRDGDRAVYDVVDQSGTSLGTSEFSFARDGEAWILTAADKLDGLDQVARVRVDGATLKPFGEEKTIRAPDTDVKLTTTYTQGKLDIVAVVNGEDRAAAITVPATALDNDQLLMTLRALRFAEGYEGRYVNIVGASASRVNTVIRVQGQETVEVPAGEFEAWRVELDFGQAKQYAWYQVDAPHDMVQYDNGAIRFVLTGR